MLGKQQLLSEIRRVLVLHIQHLFIHLLRRHTAAEHPKGCEVAAVPRVGGTHHVLGVEHLLRQLRHLGSATSQARKGRPETSKPWTP